VVLKAASLRSLLEPEPGPDDDPARRLALFLTTREREVLARLVRGESTAALAAEMGVTYSTARTHIQNLLTKLGVHSKLEAVAFAIAHALVQPAESEVFGAGTRS
jgi:DNA-binding NarL/FixJ family response regulator